MPARIDCVNCKPKVWPITIRSSRQPARPGPARPCHFVTHVSRTHGRGTWRLNDDLKLGESTFLNTLSRLAKVPAPEEIARYPNWKTPFCHALSRSCDDQIYANFDHDQIYAYFGHDQRKLRFALRPSGVLLVSRQIFGLQSRKLWTKPILSKVKRPRSLKVEEGVCRSMDI